MRVGPLRIMWIAIAVLSAFIIFVQCLADVGGEHDPVEQPAIPISTFAGE